MEEIGRPGIQPQGLWDPDGILKIGNTESSIGLCDGPPLGAIAPQQVFSSSAPDNCCQLPGQIVGILQRAPSRSSQKHWFASVCWELCPAHPLQGVLFGIMGNDEIDAAFETARKPMVIDSLTILQRLDQLHSQRSCLD